MFCIETHPTLRGKKKFANSYLKFINYSKNIVTSLSCCYGLFKTVGVKLST